MLEELPNWCDNKLVVSGKESDLKKFIDDNSGTNQYSGRCEYLPLIFSNKIPEPSAKDIKKGGENFLFRWYLENWGTKSEPKFKEGAGIDFSHKELAGQRVASATYEFETAWSPALSWVEKVSKIYPDLTFCISYAEEGMDIGGAFVYKNGQEKSGSYGKAKDYLLDAPVL